MSEMSQGQKERLMADLHAVVAEAESLLRATVNETGAGSAELRAKVQATLERARRGLQDLQATAVEKAKAADAYVHEKPWHVIGVAAGVGLLLGMLIARR
ncbi:MULTISPECIES: DUF883 family protein [Roseateles]|uniref:DUF883 family protein n=1 Tax=Roseateles flavus TaxID=3149041 RepID=A0ABV0GJW9_9BURK|nr:DUF883 family protein [Pelomonas sp. BJYL3]